MAVLTPDLKWVHGFSGHRDAAKWAADLDTIDASPLLDASPKVAKKLEAFAAAAEKAAGKTTWTKVFDAADDATELIGRHPARARIEAAVAQARGVAEAGLAKVFADLEAGGDRAEARKALFALQKAFKGQPEADDAATGAKAADKLGRLADVAEEFRESAREKAAAEFAGTRWTVLFGGVFPEPADDPGDGDGADE